MTALAEAIVGWVEAHSGAAVGGDGPLLMVSGAQGIGKSTAMAALRAHPTLRLAVLGLDDFYHPRAHREMLGCTVHPLCETRGPPGTHDLGLLAQVIARLRAGAGAAVPVFDKRIDDRLPEAQWSRLEGRFDAIVLEGWMLGALSDLDAPMAPPLNALEAADDPHGLWRGWQEQALRADYLPLWQQAAAFLHLRAPAFEVVSTWRRQQEETTLGLAPGTLPPERAAWVDRFIQHYERITRRMLAGAAMPGVVLRVDAQRRLVA